MIEIFGKRFAENIGEMTDALFLNRPTPVGFARRLVRSIEFKNLQGETQVVLDHKGVFFPPTVSCAFIDFFGPMSPDQEAQIAWVLMLGADARGRFYAVRNGKPGTFGVKPEGKELESLQKAAQNGYTYGVLLECHKEWWAFKSPTSVSNLFSSATAKVVGLVHLNQLERKED